ncbi:MAG: ATP-binding cassette domain-containing protein [Planctomycetota bacterium]
MSELTAGQPSPPSAAGRSQREAVSSGRTERPPPVLTLRRFSLGFRAARHVAWVLDRVDLELPSGRFYLLSGPSGAGKSTLIDFLAGEHDPLDPARVTRGKARLVSRAGRRAKVVALFQQDGLWDDLTVVDNVRLATGGHGRGSGAAEALRMLARVGLPDPPRRVTELSGGQRKRVALARALALEPDLLLLDEPTAGLDNESARLVLAALRELCREARGALTLILISHDVAAARPVVDGEIVLPGDGRLVLLERPGTAPPVAAGRAKERDSWLAWLGLPCLAAASLASSLFDILVALLPQDPLRCLFQGVRRLLMLLPFLVLAGFFLGAITLHFVLRNDPLHGAQSTILLSGAGKVLLAALIPLLGALLYAAPAVSGILAHVGSMARDRQLAAYRALRRSVRREVLSPLLWSHLIALPLVMGGTLVAAVFGSWTADFLARATSLESFLPPFLESVTGGDLSWGLLKSLGAAVFLTWIPWHLARRRGLSPSELAIASLRAWTCTALAILGWNGLLLFPQLG